MSPRRRTTIVDEPPPSNAKPSVAPNERISAANSGRFKPTLTSGCRPSTSMRKSRPSGATAAPEDGIRFENSGPLGPSPSSFHAPLWRMSGPPPIAVAISLRSNGARFPQRRNRRVDLRYVDRAIVAGSDRHVVAGWLGTEIIGDASDAIACERRRAVERLEFDERDVLLRAHAAVLRRDQRETAVGRRQLVDRRRAASCAASITSSPENVNSAICGSHRALSQGRNASSAAAKACRFARRCSQGGSCSRCRNNRR